MIFTEAPLKGAYVIDPELHTDDRGFFARTFCQREFAAHGLRSSIAQVSIAANRLKGTLRGMHFQVAPAAEAKKRSSWRATQSRAGKKTSLRLPSASVYQTLLRGPGAAPNAILRPGPHIGGAPGPPGASIGC